MGMSVRMALQSRFKKSTEQTLLPPGSPRLLNLKQAANYLAVREWAVRTMARTGKLRVVQIGKSRRYLFDIFDLNQVIEQSKAVQ
jgi:excisionase family DNA binding protein